MIFGNDSYVTLGDKRFDSVSDLTKFYESSEFEAAYTYYGNDLGAVYSPKQTVFKLWSPAARYVSLAMYKTGTDLEEGALFFGEFPMESDPKSPGVWTLTKEGDWAGIYYTFLVDIDGVMSETADPYARAAGANGFRSMVVDLEATDPEGWDEDDYAFTKPATKAVIWETHVKDFSHCKDSGMTPRGTYQALGQRGTTLRGEGKIPTGVDHLLDLGVTHVHLLPIQDYATVDETVPTESYNWGYDPLNYNVPEGSFSTDPFHGEVRIKELKEAILRLHKAGIGVILDVVYNHTYYTEASWFEKVMPYYYHRALEDGRMGNASGCGNETASERSMMRLFMLDSIRYWAEEYHVDGFRFDLMGVHDVDTMWEVERMLRGLGTGKAYVLYGEPWAALPVALPSGKNPADMGHLKELPKDVAVFSDRTRDCVKGSVFNKAEKGFVSGAIGFEERVKSAIRAHYEEDGSMPPTRTITYVSSHDNHTLWDKLTLTVDSDGSGFDQPEMIRVAANKLAAAIVITSQGIPFFQSGEEFARTKYGDGNSYHSDAHVNDIRWSRLETFKELNDYYKGLLSIRRSFSPFTDESGKAAASIRFLVAEDQLVGYAIPGVKAGEAKWMLLFFNASETEKTVELMQDEAWPASWNVLANEKQASAEPFATVQGTAFTVHVRSALILASEARI